MLANNGRIKPDMVIVDGREEKHEEGAYYLEWREGTKRIRLSVGTTQQRRTRSASAKKQN